MLIRWPFQFDRVSFGILYVYGRTVAFSPVTRLKFAANNTVLREVCANCFLLKGFDPNTEVVHVPTLFPGCGATLPPDLAVNRNYINQGITGTQLNQPEFRRGPPLDITPQDAAIKPDHRLDVPSAYDHVIQAFDPNHIAYK